jgi:hypothetical protein
MMEGVYNYCPYSEIGDYRTKFWAAPCFSASFWTGASAALAAGTAGESVSPDLGFLDSP